MVGHEADGVPALPPLAGSPSHFGSAVSMPGPPSHPVWKMVRDYQGPRADQPQADAAMVGALVWCDRARSVPRQLWEARSQGADPAYSARLEHTHEQSVALCARLGVADYRVAVDILRLHARAGDAEARTYFSMVGPRGVQEDAATRDAIPLDEAALVAWEREAIGYLRHPPVEQRAMAYSMLAVMLDRRPPYGGVLFGDGTRDPVEANAYLQLWASTLHPLPAVRDMVRRESAHLTPAQIVAAYNRARTIAAEDGATPSSTPARVAPAQ